MGYEFDTGSEHISYGTDLHFAQFSCAAGAWIYVLPGVSDDQEYLAKQDNFPMWKMTLRTSISDGYGVTAEHIIGGGTALQCTCFPGLVDTRFKLNVNTWLYIGFSRDDTLLRYSSFFGTRTAMIDGPVTFYGSSQHPLGPAVPGQVMGPWVVGGQVTGLIVGPAHFWRRPLTKAEHLLMAQCTLPPGSTDLVWWGKMFFGAVDYGPYSFTPTFSSPPPVYVPDNGCASFAQGVDYRAYYED